MQQVQAQAREAALKKELEELKEEVEVLKDGEMNEEYEDCREEKIDVETKKVSKYFIITNFNVSV